MSDRAGLATDSATLLWAVARRQLALCSSILQALVLSRARVGRDFYLAVPVGMMLMSSYTTSQAMTMVAGEEAGIARGELQASQNG
jgi:hypothetical protein